MRIADLKIRNLNSYYRKAISYWIRGGVMNCTPQASFKLRISGSNGHHRHMAKAPRLRKATCPLQKPPDMRKDTCPLRTAPRLQ